MESCDSRPEAGERDGADSVKSHASRLHPCLDDIARDGEASGRDTGDKACNQSKDEVVVGLRGESSQDGSDHF